MNMREREVAGGPVQANLDVIAKFAPINQGALILPLINSPLILNGEWREVHLLLSPETQPLDSLRLVSSASSRILPFFFHSLLLALFAYKEWQEISSPVSGVRRTNLCTKNA